MRFHGTAPEVAEELAAGASSTTCPRNGVPIPMTPRTVSAATATRGLQGALHHSPGHVGLLFAPRARVGAPSR